MNYVTSSEKGEGRPKASIGRKQKRKQNMDVTKFTILFGQRLCSMKEGDYSKPQDYQQGRNTEVAEIGNIVYEPSLSPSMYLKHFKNHKMLQHSQS